MNVHTIDLAQASYNTYLVTWLSMDTYVQMLYQSEPQENQLAETVKDRHNDNQIIMTRICIFNPY